MRRTPNDFRTIRAIVLIVTLGSLLSACSAQRAPFGGPIVQPLWHAANVTIQSAPIVDGGSVYVVGAGADQLQHGYAFDAKSGRLRWVTKKELDWLMPIGGNVLLAGNHDEHLALDERTGAPIPFGPANSLDQAAYAGGTIYAFEYPGTIDALSRTGELQWRRHLNLVQVQSLVAGGGAVYAGGDRNDGRGQPGKAVYALDGRTGAVRWDLEFGDPFLKASDPPTILSDERGAYVWRVGYKESDNTTFCQLLALDAATGHVRWQRNSEACVNPAFIDPATIVVCEGSSCCSGSSCGPDDRSDGDVFVALRRSDGKELWRSTTNWNYGTWIYDGARAIVSDQRVHSVSGWWVRNYTYDCWLTLVDLHSGNELWRTPLQELTQCTPAAIGDGIVAAGSGEGGLWAFPLSAPARQKPGAVGRRTHSGWELPSERLLSKRL